MEPEKNMIWKYRYAIKKDLELRKGVVKFVQSVDWERKNTSIEAIKILQEWDIDFESALFLLSWKFCANPIYGFGIAKERCSEIREIAVKCLEKQKTESLQFIMLQLIQAYRYEDFQKGTLKQFLLS